MIIKKKDCFSITSVVRNRPCGHFESVVIVILPNMKKYELDCKTHFKSIEDAEAAGYKFIHEVDAFEFIEEKRYVLFPEHETLQ